MSTVIGQEADAFAAHPDQRIEAALNNCLTQVGVGSVLRDARHVVEELLFRVAAEIGSGYLFVAEVRNQLLDIFDAIVNHAPVATCKPTVATTLILRRSLKKHHVCASAARG